MGSWQLRDTTSLPPRVVPPKGIAVVRRLSALGQLSPAEIELLAACLGKIGAYEAGHELLPASAPMNTPKFVLSGWVCRNKALSDGREQIIDFYLPGELAGYCSRDRAHAKASYIALTDCFVADATDLAQTVQKDPSRYPVLADALHDAEENAECRLIDQIVRNSRMLAHERMAHFALDIHHRLNQAGLCVANSFAMPLTQEYIGEALGLSTVHVNRTMQFLRREHLIRTASGRWEIPQPDRLSQLLAGDDAEGSRIFARKNNATGWRGADTSHGNEGNA